MMYTTPQVNERQPGERRGKLLQSPVLIALFIALCFLGCGEASDTSKNSPSPEDKKKSPVPAKKVVSEKEKETETKDVETTDTSQRDLSGKKLAQADETGDSNKSDSSGPRITFDKTSIEFGEVVQGEDLVRYFNFQNTGDAPLRITKINSSCTCFPSLLSKRVLNPGQKGKIKVTFKTKGLAAQYHNLYIDVFHNDPRLTNGTRYISRLRMAGKVIMLFKIMPPGAEYLGSFESNSPPTRNLVILPLHRKSFSIKKLIYDKKLISITTSPRRLSNGTVAQKVSVKVKENVPPGEMVCPIKAITDDPKQPVIFFKVWGQSMGAIQHEPNYLLFGPTKRGGEKMTRAIAVFQRRGSNLKVLRVDGDRKFFDIKTSAIVEKKRYEVALAIRPDAPMGPFSKTIWIYTNQPRQPVLKTVVLGSLEPQLKINPRGFYLPGKVVSTVKINAPGGDSTVIKVKKVTVPGFVASITTQKDGSRLLVLKGTDKAKAGNVSGEVVLSTNLEGEKTVTVPIFGTWSR